MLEEVCGSVPALAGERSCLAPEQLEGAYLWGSQPPSHLAVHFGRRRRPAAVATLLLTCFSRVLCIAGTRAPNEEHAAAAFHLQADEDLLMQELRAGVLKPSFVLVR
jgi:hypothetical protein